MWCYTLEFSGEGGYTHAVTTCSVLIVIGYNWNIVGSSLCVSLASFVIAVCICRAVIWAPELVRMWNGLLVALALNLWFVWSVMAAGEEAEGSLAVELKALFETTKNSVKLGASLVIALVTYFIAVVKVKDVDEHAKG